MKPSIRYLVLGLGLGTVGWFLHSWLLDVSLPSEGVRIVSQSIQQLFLHKIIFSASFLVLGISLAICIPRNHRGVPLLIINAVAAMVLWFWFFRYRMEKVHGDVSASTHLAAFDIGIDEIPLYEPGLFAAAAVFLTAGIFFLLKKKEKID